jgi:hypothetical protein
MSVNTQPCRPRWKAERILGTLLPTLAIALQPVVETQHESVVGRAVDKSRPEAATPQCLRSDLTLVKGLLAQKSDPNIPITMTRR